jgi:hypothetical protein
MSRFRRSLFCPRCGTEYSIGIMDCSESDLSPTAYQIRSECHHCGYIGHFRLVDRALPETPASEEDKP